MGKYIAKSNCFQVPTITLQALMKKQKEFFFFLAVSLITNNSSKKKEKEKEKEKKKRKDNYFGFENRASTFCVVG